ncbi:MAG: Holliday junction branch migration protein RuvA [Bacteroidales bacterium]|nr:Holliday junction branch migration protein RuvA [Bacteroidales bacterium]
MYSHIEGLLTEKKPTYVVVDCQGVGYQIHISLHTYGKLPEANANNQPRCKLLTHLIVREDALLLYGFVEENERDLFKELITVSGIGSNTARLILSSLSPQEIRSAIRRGEASLLQSIKGIGAKTAQRIIIDLSDRLDKPGFAGDILETQYNTRKDEALSGLVMLGFNKPLADKTLQKIINSGGANLSVEDLIKNALKLL